MFLFIIRYFGFLKTVPGLAILFDNGLKLVTMLTKPKVLDWIDEIEVTVLKWPHTSVTTHKFGGIQFNCNGKEIGHIHSNGLMDLLMSRKFKAQWMEGGRIKDHHTIKKSGWISFYLIDTDDKDYALQLLRAGYEKQCNVLK